MTPRHDPRLCFGARPRVATSDDGRCGRSLRDRESRRQAASVAQGGRSAGRDDAFKRRTALQRDDFADRRTPFAFLALIALLMAPCVPVRAVETVEIGGFVITLEENETLPGRLAPPPRYRRPAEAVARQAPPRGSAARPSGPIADSASPHAPLDGTATNPALGLTQGGLRGERNPPLEAQR